MEALFFINVEDIDDDEREELGKTLAWVDIETQNLDFDQLKSLFKTSQQLLRLKSEQVEALLQELDELAIKKAKEKTETERVGSAKSWKTRSSTIEYENLEQKYLDLKSKFKRSAHNNEKYTIEIEMLNKKIKRLEKEKRQLENELQTRFQNETESDTSESVKNHQKDLLNVVQNKNLQISELLRDIEDVEKENSVLREKLLSVKEELSSAANEMLNMKEVIKSKDIIIQEHEENSRKTLSILESLQGELEHVKEEKITLERDIAEFSGEIEQKIDKWKALLDRKNAEIHQLKSNKIKLNDISSIKSLENTAVGQTHVEYLQIIISERETKLAELKSQLELSTKELTESADILKMLRIENDTKGKKIEELDAALKEVKAQLQKAHQRSSKLQDEVRHAENLMQVKDTEVKELLKAVKENGYEELSDKLKQTYTLKNKIIIQEKQITELVSANNLMQEKLETLEKENSTLRSKLDLEEDEIFESTYTSKEEKLKKENEKLSNKFEKLKEEKIQLKTEIKDLTKKVANFTNQLVDLGQKPNQTTAINKTVKTEGKIEKELDSQIRALSEENEALRRGLHDILDSVKIKQDSSPREIKSETLEKLLKALDVKHISGWYHPAMRLQAELHTLEGVNKELRDQLQQTRVEIFSLKSQSAKYEEQKLPRIVEKLEIQGKVSEENTEIENKGKENEIMTHVANIDAENLEQLKISILKIVMEISNASRNSEETIEKIFAQIKKNIEALHKNCAEDKMSLQQELKKEKLKLKELFSDKENAIENLADKDLHQLNNVLQRKVIYLFKELESNNQILEENKNKYTKQKNNFFKKILSLTKKVLLLQSHIKITEHQCSLNIDKKDFENTQNTLNSTLLKYRKLLDETKEQSKEESLEIEILKKTQENLINERALLRSKLVTVLTELHKVNLNKTEDKTMAEKLAESQVKEISEKQRADHTNNLYELVKEQLHKSEDKFKEFSKCGESLLLKNLTLQEQLKEAENQLTSFVGKNIFEDLEVKYEKLLKERDEQSAEVIELKQQLVKYETTRSINQTWNDLKEQELLNLKHQIVDLVSTSEEKILVAQLHSDIARYRQKEVEYKTEIETLKIDLVGLQEENQRLQKDLTQSKSDFDLFKLQSNRKNRVLQDLLFKQKAQYFGCIPLCVEEAFVESLRTTNQQKHETFLSLQKTRELENENSILKDTLTNNKALDDLSQDNKNEFQLKRRCEFKENQIQYLTDRIKVQDLQITKLEEELLSTYRAFDFGSVSKQIKKPKLVKQVISQEYIFPEKSVDVPDKATAPVKILRNVGCQKSLDISSESVIKEDNLAAFKSQVTNLLTDVTNLKARITNLQLENSTKEQYIAQLKLSFNNQISEQQNKIVYLEKKVKEIQESKKDMCQRETGAGDGARVLESSFGEEEIMSLKTSLKTLQDSLALKDQEIMRYQTLLKEDRDKHSMAAANLQQELQNLQKAILLEKQKNESLEESSALSKQKNAAVEKYVAQVHALEHHLAELHTDTASLEARWQASQQEATRWRVLAADRLRAMEELGRNLDDQHKKELLAYKEECEKYIEFGKESPISHRNRPIFENDSVESSTRIDADILKLIREKDNKIRELTNKLKQQSRTKSSESRYSLESLPYDKTDGEFGSVFKEVEVLQRRCEQLTKKELALKDETRELKNQLLKKPNFASLNKSERTIKHQLQKKISSLENEIAELNKKLEQQMMINEKHKHISGEDFEKWKKQKYWQENYEKNKNKLKEKEEEFEKLSQTCTGYRLLIERLEREKLTLENRNKMLTNVATHPAENQEVQILKIKNERLSKELEDVSLKLEMQHHHSGGLGAAMLQEKLESQERKIAVLELSAKGSSELRSEIERLQSSISNLQKSNLCLEAENLELKMDLEKCNKETPHLQEQIQYLESYIEVLKNEKIQTEAENNTSKQPSNDCAANPGSSENKTVAQLERTVYILKRVVEKLQAENKRLLSGRRASTERSVSAEKLKRDYVRLKEKYTEALQTISKLEAQLATTNKKLQVLSSGKSHTEKVEALSHEISELREELSHKTHLLDKVKSLLQRAASKEKLLLQEISRLKNENDAKEMGFPSPVLEESEVSSDT